jgi:hypothetical protein
MKITKLFVLLAIAYYVAGARKGDNYEGGNRFKAIKCVADSRYAVVKVCNVKAYSRRIVSLYFDVDFLQPLERPFYFRGLFQLRTGLKFHTMIDTKKIEVCNILDGNVNNAMVEFIVHEIKHFAPTFFHKCPFTNFAINNISILNDFDIGQDNFDPAQWIPSGVHRADIFLLKKRVVVLNVNVSIEYKTSRNHSFAIEKFIKQYV